MWTLVPIDIVILVARINYRYSLVSANLRPMHPEI